MNTKQSNRLIAEFMGFIPDEYEKRAGKPLEYHKSWDCLMPVIFNILTLDNDDGYFYNGFIGLIVESDPFPLIYARVVEYIEWYNKQIK